MRKTVRAIFDTPEMVTSEDVAKSNELKELLKIHVPYAINDAIVANKIYASVFEINDTNVYLDIHKNNWIQALETCLLWYVENESYEMCVYIKDLIQAIKNKGKGNVTIKGGKDGEGF